MKLTDIDLSNLAEVAAAVTLLEHVHRELATGGTPLPSLPPACQEFVVNPAPAGPIGSGEVVMTQVARMLDLTMPGETGGTDAATVFGSSPRAPELCETYFGGAPTQSAAPLPQSAPATAGAAASPTAPAVPLGSGPTSPASALPALVPLPAPSAAAPAAPVAQPSPAEGVELDRDGLPWDARIHTGTKRKNDDGRWSRKRGINDPDLVPRVEAQLRAQMATGEAARRDAQIEAGLPQVSVPVAALTSQPVTLGQLHDLQQQANVTSPIVAQSAAPLPVSTPAALPTTSGLASLAAPTPPALPVAQTPAAPQQSLGAPSTLAALQAAMTPACAAPAPTTFQDFMTALTVEVQAGRVPIEAFGAACQPLGGVSALNSKPELIPIAWASLKAKYPGML